MKIDRAWRTWRDELTEIALATLYPMRCRVCDRMVEARADGIACAECWSAIERERDRTTPCRKCGIGLIDRGVTAAGDRHCGECGEFLFHEARSIGPHTGALRQSVVWLKRHPQLAPRLHRMLESTWATAPEPGQFDLVLPIPLHPRRLAERKFNQAELIGRMVAGFTGCPLETVSLIRIRETERHRHGQGLADRARSLRQAFAVTAPRLIAGRRILLVDDVLTTGSTANEATRTLLDHGAREVCLLTLSRTTKRPSADR
jgi:ComF family protein